MLKEKNLGFKKKEKENSINSQTLRVLTPYKSLGHQIDTKYNRGSQENIDRGVVFEVLSNPFFLELKLHLFNTTPNLLLT